MISFLHGGKLLLLLEELGWEHGSGGLVARATLHCYVVISNLKK
jgi:hypothetical protein